MVAVKTVATSMSAGEEQNPVTVPSNPASGNGTSAWDIPAAIARGWSAGAGSAVSSQRRIPTLTPCAVGNSSTAAPGYCLRSMAARRLAGSMRSGSSIGAAAIPSRIRTGRPSLSPAIAPR